MTGQGKDLPPRNWSSLFLFVLLAAGLMVGGMVILGIPGALVAGVTAPVVEAIRGFPTGTLTDGDRAWPVAILLTMIFPPGIPLSFWLSRVIWPELNRWLRALAIVGGTWVWTVLALLVTTLLG